MSGDSLVSLEIKADNSSTIYCQLNPNYKINERNKEKYQSLKMKEFEEGYKVFQDLLVANLKHLEGKEETVNKDIQVIDEETLMLVANLKFEIGTKITEIDNLVKKNEEQKIKFEQEIANKDKEYESRELQFKKEIVNLNEKWRKLYKELIQVKHILRTPYLYK